MGKVLHNWKPYGRGYEWYTTMKSLGKNAKLEGYAQGRYPMVVYLPVYYQVLMSGEGQKG